MQDESRLGRSLWAILLSVVVAIVIFSFARHPLLGGDGEASGFSRPLTLWVAGAEGNGQAQATARELAGCWEMSGRPVTVGVLPGGASSSVVDFLERVHGTPDELLLITSTTLSDIARDRQDQLLPEPREHAQRAVHLLAGAAPIAALGGERLALAVRADSPVHSSSELLSARYVQTSPPLFGVAEDTWLEGNLAALVNSSGLHGDLPYSVFTSSRSAVLSLEAGEVQAVLAPYGAIHQAVRSGRVRELPWPRAGGRTPRTWSAIVAPTGLSTATIHTLREQTRGLCTGPERRRLLRKDGISQIAPASVGLASFVGDGVHEASQRQALVERIMRSY
ncbi:MAG TPA: hypothetical protein VGI24_04800 [Solirubrobacteraceae bacterium]